MTPTEKIAYQRKWRKKHPHYGRDKMREVRQTDASLRERAGTKVILGIPVRWKLLP